MKRSMGLVFFLLVGIPLSLQASWEKLDLPTDHGFTTIWAINEQTIFVSGDQGLWKTFNGTTWLIDSGYQSSTIYFPNDTLGFLRGSILTTDGGVKWLKGDTINGNVGKINFPKWQSIVGYGLGYDYVSKTTDGGWHWSKLPLFPDVYTGYDEDITPSRISFPSNPDTGYVTANCTKIINDSTFEDHTSYFKTTDGGETWVLNEEGLYNDDFRPYLVDFPENATVGYMAGGDGKVFKTTNGGATWDTVLKDTSMSMNDMHFPETGQWGYVIGSNKAYRTLDGGQTWQHHAFGGDTILLSCHFVDNRLGFITGINNIEKLCILYDPGFVMKTTDGLLGVAEDDWVDVKPGLIEVVSPPIGSEVTLRYSDHPQGFHAQVYDASGRKVDELHSSLTDGTVNWGGGRPCGVYFIRPVETEKTRPLRVVLVR